MFDAETKAMLETERMYEDKLTDDFRELFTERLKEDEKFGHEIWSALANVNWIHESDVGNIGCGHSFRSAGSLISEILGHTHKVCYMDWYMRSPCATVCKDIADAMAARGWRYEELHSKSRKKAALNISD